MYKVIGKDNVEYGPADLATLKQWAQMGSLVPETLVIDTRTGQRLTAGQIPDLQAHFISSLPLPNYLHAPGGTLPVSEIRATAAVQSKRSGIWKVVCGCAMVVLLGAIGIFWLGSSFVRSLWRSDVRRETALSEGPPLSAPAGVVPQGSLYFVPIGNTPQSTIDELVSYYDEHLGIKAGQLPRLRIPLASHINDTPQVAGEDIHSQLISHTSAHALDCVIGMLDSDLSSRQGRTNFVFSMSWGARELPGSMAIISTARFNPKFFGDRPDPELERSRLHKLATKQIGLLYYKLPPSSDLESPLSYEMNSLGAIDRHRQAF